MVTLNSLNEWFFGLKEKEQIKVLGAQNCCDGKKEALKTSNKKLLSELFVGVENVNKETLNERWNITSNEEKLETYWIWFDKETEKPMDLLDKNNYENYVLFLEKRDFVRIVGLDSKLSSIYTIEHIMKFWNDLTEKEKAERIQQL